MLESSLVLARCSDLKYEHMLVLARARGFNARTRSVLGILMLDPSLQFEYSNDDLGKILHESELLLNTYVLCKCSTFALNVCSARLLACFGHVSQNKFH